MNVLDINANEIKLKLEKIYEKKSNYFEIPDLLDNSKKLNTDDPNEIFESFEKSIKKDYPEYNFKIELIEGQFEFKEKPMLIYDKNEGKYFFEITRQIQFKENLPFKNLKVTLKIKYYKIILKSLFFGALIALILILIPLIMIFSRTIIKPIINVSKGVREIASGNLGILIKSGSNDEIGELASSFNNMSKELYKMKSIRDDLLAVISHELRTPLARIKGYTELLNDLKLKKNEKDIYFNSILNEIDFLNTMVAEIIEVSRLELDKEQLITEKLDLSVFLKDIKDNLELSTSINKNVKYIFNYENDLCCEIDVEKFKRVFLNIIENSIKAGATLINLTAAKDSNKIFITITDNGCGIPEDQLELVFEKFYRVDKSRDRKTGGFGLGLSICKGIIKEHKGNIYFAKKDNGAELHIELPLIKE
jgi:signal transduction histidine kinase